ncbi:MAG: YggS family pyridoxal phosphate-dependent enzyme [Anaerolineae bacterium]
MADIEANLQEVQERIAEAAERSGREFRDVTLVAITKLVEVERIQAAIDLGLREFGENRVYEALPKIEQLPPEITWHMVGHLQRRKVRDAVKAFSTIHSVDSLRLAQEINKRCGRFGLIMPVLLEVNVSGEESKYGFPLVGGAQKEEQTQSFFAAVRDILALPQLEVQGLMTMAPYVPDAETVRPVFRKLRNLRDELREQFPEARWPHLSMGMTNDFEVAVEEGATLVRIGTAIFGARRR